MLEFPALIPVGLCGAGRPGRGLDCFGWPARFRDAPGASTLGTGDLVTVKIGKKKNSRRCGSLERRCVGNLVYWSVSLPLDPGLNLGSGPPDTKRPEGRQIAL